MNNKKLFLLCFLLLTAILIFTSAVFAQNQEPQFFNYSLTDEGVDALIYANTEERLNTSNFTMKIGDQELPVDELTYMSDSDYGTSWLVVIEPVPSNQNKAVMQREIAGLINQIAENMSGSDNMAIYTTFGTKYPFNNDKRTISTVVNDSLRKVSDNASDKMIYDTIYEAVDTLKTDSTLNKHKVLLVISEFPLDSSSRSRLDDLADNIKDFNGTIYLVGITQGYAGKMQDYETVAALINTKNSGVSYGIEKLTENVGKTTAEKIIKNESYCRVLSTKYESMAPFGDGELKFVITLNTGKMTISTDPLYIQAADLNAYIPQANETPEPTPEEPTATPEPTATEAVTETPAVTETADTGIIAYIKSHLGLCIGIAAALIALIAFIIVYSKGKKPRDDKKPPRPIGGTPKPPVVINTPGQNGGGQTETIDERVLNTEPGGGKGGDGPEQVSPKPGPGTQLVAQAVVRMTNVKTGQVFEGNITDMSLKAGRTSDPAFLQLTGDAGISQAHMEYIWQNGCLYVQDTKSKNGTFVNGRRITGAVPLSQNDTIRAGTTDFRVNWTSHM